MAEKIDGSYSFSILDDRDNIYLVKGDSPLSVIHFPIQKMYVYASTDEILYRALIDSPLFSALKKGEFEMVDIKEGDIVKICSDGKLKYGKFEYSCYYGRAWWDYSFPAYEDRAKSVNKSHATISFSTHYCEVLDLFNRQDNIWITKCDKKVYIENMYSKYNVRSGILKSKQFYNDAFETAINYEDLMKLKKELMS